MRKNFVSLASALAVFLFAGSVLAQPTLPPPGWAPAGTPVAQYGRLKVDGKQIQSTKTNANVQLRGMSLAWSSDNSNNIAPADFYTQETVSWLAADWRASLIRAAMGVSDKDGPFQVAGIPYKGSEAVHKRMIQTVVNSAIWSGIYVIIDWHSHHASTFGGSYPNGERPEAIAFFTEMAETYKDYPNVIYEIYNEPYTSAHNWSNIVSYATPVIDAIRAKDPLGIIVVGTPNYSKMNAEGGGVSAISGKTNIAYTLHFYCDHNFTGQITGASLPVFVTEFGLSQSSGNGTCGGIGGTDYMKTWFDAMDNNSISWANWALSNRPEDAAALKGPESGGRSSTVLRNGNWTTNDLTASGTFIRNKLRGSNPGNNPTYSVTASVPEGGGTVGGSHTNIAVCGNATMTATPAANMKFEGWVINDVNGTSVSSATYTRTLCHNLEIAAYFAPINLINNSTFTTGTSGWTTMGTGISIERVDRQLKINMPSDPGAAAGAFRVMTNQDPNVTFTQGRKYRLKFSARAASGSRTITPTYRPGGSLSSWVELEPVTLQAGTAMQTFTVEFDRTAATGTGPIGFAAGGSATGWFLDNVTLEDIGQSTSVEVKTTVAARPFAAAFNGRSLVLTGGGRSADVKIYDMAGRVRLSRAVSLSNTGADISLNMLPAGVYAVRYKVDGKAVSASERIVLGR